MPHREDSTVKPFHPIQEQSKRDRILSFAHDAKSKTQGFLGIKPVELTETRSHVDKTIDSLRESAAFNPSNFLENPEKDESTTKEKAAEFLETTKRAILNPGHAIKNRATRETAGVLARSRPVLNRRADLELLDLFKELEDGDFEKNEHDLEEDIRVKDEKVVDIKVKIEDITGQRLDLEVAWQTNRHVQRVRVVRRTRGLFPLLESFEFLDEDGQKKIDWPRYIAEGLVHFSYPFTAEYVDDIVDEELPFDANVLRRQVERIIIVSAPLQVWLSNVRKIYRWESPWSTAKWLAIYLVLLYSRRLVTFVWGYFVYRTLKNYYRGEDINELKLSIERTLHRESTAFKIAELMDQHGNKDWLGPFMEQIGPHLQIQINDLANLLEIMYSFYHWRDPTKTQRTLILMSMMFLVGLITSTDFCLQISYFVGGLMFFLCCPVSSRWPKYRLCVSLVRVLFYNIPTHSEWCFQYLQQRAVAVLSSLNKKTEGREYTGAEGLGSVRADSKGLFMDTTDVPTEVPSVPRRLSAKRPIDILSFSCLHAHTPGQLIVSAIGLRFHSTLPHVIDPHPTTDFAIVWSQIEEIRKCDPVNWMLKSAGAFTPRLQRMELQIRNLEDVQRERMGVVDGNEDLTSIMLEGFKGRDKAFNAIIGFSGLKWTNVQHGWGVS